MNLPEDPKERTQILVLAGIVGLTVIAALVMFVIKPQAAKKAVIDEESALIENELSSTRKDIARMNKGRVRNHEILKELVALSDHGEHILQPHFGRNYLLVAKEIVGRHAKTSGAEVHLREAGFSGAPRNPRALTPSMVRYYNIQLTLKNGGIHELYRLLKELEIHGPYINVTDISIAGSATTPGKHTITARVQWPVWVKEDTPDNLKQQVAEMDKMAPSRTKPKRKIRTD